MSTIHARSDLEFDAWLAGSPSEDELRAAYVELEARRTDLWTPGHIDSFRREEKHVNALRHVSILQRKSKGS